MASTIAPIDGITYDNRSGEVIVFLVTACCFSVFFTFIRYITAIRKHLGLGIDDVFFILSLLLAIMQSLTIGYAIHNGLGRHTTSLSATQVTNFFKNTYIGRILAVTSICCAKLSLTFLYQRLDLYPDRHISLIPLFSAAGWILFSIFALAFQCHLPSPWLISSSHCPAGPSLTITIAVLNCLSDVVLVVYPAPALWALSMPVSARLTVIALFSSRILVCIMAVIDVTFAVRIFSSLDPTWDQLTPVITAVVLVHLSIITAMTPRLNSFLRKIPSGQASSRIPLFTILNRLTVTNTTGTRTASNGSTNMVKSVPGNSAVPMTHGSSILDQRRIIGGTLADSDDMTSVPSKSNASSSSGAQSDDTHK